MVRIHLPRLVTPIGSKLQEAPVPSRFDHRPRKRKPSHDALRKHYGPEISAHSDLLVAMKLG